MSVRQRQITDPPPITDGMTRGATGATGHDFVGQTITTTYQIPDSDRGEILLRCASGRVLLLSTDPGYNDDLAVSRNHERWEFFVYDATDSEAGRAMQKLEPGEWL
jgi:hypothetical protein